MTNRSGDRKRKEICEVVATAYYTRLNAVRWDSPSLQAEEYRPDLREPSDAPKHTSHQYWLVDMD